MQHLVETWKAASDRAKGITAVSTFFGLGIFFCCCSLFLISASAEPRPTPTPTLFIPPTPTPTPTPPPTATSTPKGLSQESLDYLSEVQTQVVILVFALDAVGNLLIQAGDAPALLYDLSWRTDAGIEIAVAKNAHEYLVEMVAPPEMTDFHAELTQGTSYCYEAAASIESGLDALDDDFLDVAATYFETAVGYMELCGDKMVDVMGQLNELQP